LLLAAALVLLYNAAASAGVFVSAGFAAPSGRPKTKLSYRWNGDSSNNPDDVENAIDAAADAGTAAAERSTAAKSAFEPWPQPSVECRGDYGEEAWLERHVGGPLYEKQSLLPDLPVPSLEQTAEKLVPTCLPLAESSEEKRQFLKACDSFPEQALELQRLLVRRAEQCSNNSPETRTSWLQQWWTTLGYLRVRDPVAAMVSYFLLVPDDTDCTNGDGEGRQQYQNGKRQICRGAALLWAMAEMRKLICSGQLAAETVGDVPLCSTGFKYLFHSCRIPQPEEDAYKIYDPALHKHCVVACKNQFYAVDFVDSDDDPLPLRVLERRLLRCRQLAATSASSSSKSCSPEIGWLTSQKRDDWAKARAHLLELGGSNMERALSKLESGAFVLNLDDEVRLRAGACENAV